MDTAIINIRVKPEEKRQAQEAAEALGMPLSVIIKGFLTQFSRTRSISFTAEEPTPQLLKDLAQSEKEAKAGKVLSFETKKELLNYLDEEIANEKRNN